MRVTATENVTLIILSVFWAYGLILGIAVGGNNESGFFEFASKWSTLIGASVGIFAAGIAIYNSTKQITWSLRLKEADFKRENHAARAALGHALSNVCQCMQETLAWTRAQESGHAERTTPTVSPETIAILERNVRFGTAEAVKDIARLMSDIQIHKARSAGYVGLDFPLRKHHRECIILDSLKIYVFAANLFKYSRFHDPDQGEMTLLSAFNSNRRLIPHSDEIREIISDRLAVDE